MKMKSFIRLNKFTLLLAPLLCRGSAFMSSTKTCTATSKSSTIAAATSSSTALNTLPSLVVFDLDNTLWTPELYQLRKLSRANKYPVAHKDVKLFPAVKSLIEQIKNDPDGRFANTKFAVASRTKSVEWAHDLLDQFELRDMMDYIEIFPGDKKKHFTKLADASGIHFSDMIFFDDNRGKQIYMPGLCSAQMKSSTLPLAFCQHYLLTPAQPSFFG